MENSREYPSLGKKPEFEIVARTLLRCSLKNFPTEEALFQYSLLELKTTHKIYPSYGQLKVVNAALVKEKCYERLQQHLSDAINHITHQLKIQ